MNLSSRFSLNCEQTSLRELTTLGIKNAENLAIPSVRNDVSPALRLKKLLSGLLEPDGLLVEICEICTSDADSIIIRHLIWSDHAGSVFVHSCRYHRILGRPCRPAPWGISFLPLPSAEIIHAVPDTIMVTSELNHILLCKN